MISSEMMIDLFKPEIIISFEKFWDPHETSPFLEKIRKENR